MDLGVVGGAVATRSGVKFITASDDLDDASDLDGVDGTATEDGEDTVPLKSESLARLEPLLVSECFPEERLRVPLLAALWELTVPGSFDARVECDGTAARWLPTSDDMIDLEDLLSVLTEAWACFFCACSVCEFDAPSAADDSDDEMGSWLAWALWNQPESFPSKCDLERRNSRKG